MNLSLIHTPSAEIFGTINELQEDIALLAGVIMDGDEISAPGEILESMEMHRDYLKSVLAERN